jgi:hypothetical protein
VALEPRRFPSDQRVRDLERLYLAAQRTITAQVRAALTAGNLDRAAERRMQLAAVLAVLDQLGAATDPLARDLIRAAYTDGSAHAAKGVAAQIGASVSDVAVSASFTGVSREAVETLQDAILGRLDTARRTVGRQVDDVYAKAGRRASMRALLGAEGSPRAATADLARDLRRRGVTGFVDRAGKRWRLDSYAEMAVRTVTREAVVQGSMDRMASHGVDLARVSAHGSSCSVCLPWEGRLISLSGSVSEYQGEAVADASMVPPYHPRCKHSLSPVVVEVEALREELGVSVTRGVVRA